MCDSSACDPYEVWKKENVGFEDYYHEPCDEIVDQDLTACDCFSFLQLPTLSPADREAEEYAVYRAILGESENLCIASQTTSAKPQCGYPELAPELIADYETHNFDIMMSRQTDNL